MNKRILILCEAIEPPAYSPRIMTLNRYLEHAGWITTLVAEPIALRSGAHAWDSLPTFREKRYFDYVQQQIVGLSFDLVFCSTYHYFPLQTAGKIAQLLHCPLVTDLRDIREQWGASGFYTRSLSCSWLDKIAKHLFDSYHLRQRNRVLSQAAAVTTVSPWHQQTLSRFNPHCHCIYNGFDPNEIQPNDTPSDTFRIVYLGQLHSLGKRNPLMLFEALAQIPELTIHVDFYSGQTCAEELKKMAQHYHVSLTIHDYVPREQIETIMQQASILLILGQKATPQGAHGIMTTKFFEGLGIEKPQLLVESDGECLAQTMAYTHAGLAATSVEEIKQFILDRYHEWQTKGFTRQAVQHKAEFTRQYQAQQFEQIFLSLCQK